MLQSPNGILAAVIQGQSLPAYAYAHNNPLFYTDPDGNTPCGTTYTCCIQEAMAAGLDPKEKCGSTADDIRRLMQCHDEWGECAAKCGIGDPECDDPVSHPVKTAKKKICMLGCNLALAACLKKI
jgi:hypothetical protein